ncbi:hypothetical protein SteCoe_17783 [Stentor coeruleus]|uniref:Uncharacterized protein n=1 Tax=Stentor coeruleus TaxID=5963 RepID=A0A1R2BY54_9CILI|nr:hypothetical protein SteCoe_17783 [Stentor coeruleus]
MEILLENLLIGTRVRELFDNFYQDTFKVKSNEFSLLLSQIAEEFSVDLDSIEYYFESETNVLDDDDILDPFNLNWDMFKTRLKNFLNTVLGVNYDREKYEEIEIDKIAEECFETITELQLKQFFSEAVQNIEEKIEKTKEMDKGKSWISPFLHEYKDEIHRIFDKKVIEKGMIEGNSAKIILIQILQMIRIPIEDKDMFLFDRMVENRFKQILKGGAIKYLSLTYSQFLMLLEEWAIKETVKQLSFTNHLENTIKEYLELNQDMEYPLLTNILIDLVTKLGMIHQNFISKPQNQKNTVMEYRLKALKEVFLFYARQMKMIGNTLTFDEITDHQNVLNISKFTKFCGDFMVTSKENKDHISVQIATQAFLNGTECARAMNFTQFVQAVDKLAELYYSEQYDSRNGTRMASWKIDKKRDQFYDFLGLDNKNVYMQKAKGFGLPFSKEKAGYRLPDYDLSKNYKFKNNSQQKQKIAEWKKTKEEAQNQNTNQSNNKLIKSPNPARLAAVKASILQRKDRVTWDLLKNSQQSSLISKEELNSLFTESDIKEILASSKSIYK